MLAEDHADRVTMAQIAARIGMAKPTLYRLAGSKAELQRACVEAECERVLELLHPAMAPATPDEGLLLRGVRALQRYARDSPGGFRLLFERGLPDTDAALRRLEHRVADQLRRGAGPARRGSAAPELVAAALLGAAAAVVSRAVYDGTTGVEPDAVGQLAEALAGGGRSSAAE